MDIRCSSLVGYPKDERGMATPTEVRKFLDNHEQAETKASAGRQPLREFDRLDQATLIGNALAGNVEGGAVIDRGAYDR